MFRCLGSKSIVLSWKIFRWTYSFVFPIFAANFHSQIFLISFFHCLLGSLSSFVSNSLFLLLSPLENKIIKLSILMLSQIIYSNVPFLSLSLSLSSYSFQETCNIWKDERRGGFKVSTLCESCTTLFFRFVCFFPSSFLLFNVLIIIVLYLLTATMTFRGLSNWCFRHLVT